MSDIDIYIHNNTIADFVIPKASVIDVIKSKELSDQEITCLRDISLAVVYAAEEILKHRGYEKQGIHCFCQGIRRY